MSKAKKMSIAVLIAANVLMLVMGLVTVLPNIRGAAGQDGSPADFDPDPLQEAGVQEGKEGLPQGSGSESRADLSTSERPELDDFGWYLEGINQDSVPAGAAEVKEFGYVAGGWKGLILYDPEDDYGENAADLLNVTIAGAADEVTLTADWYIMIVTDEGGVFDETDMEDTVFKGKWEKGGLWASGPGTIHLTEFYELEDRQYAIGTVDIPDGVPAVMALVRP
ncbi:MAG: hypothetical protein ACOX30_09470 [Dethiobacteria bacterium]